MINAKEILKKISAVKKEILEAEAELDRVLLDIKVLPRADKMTITKVVEEAFARVKVAKNNLIELEDDVGKSEDAHEPS